MANGKGGVGKTVSTVSLGVCIAEDYKKVLLIDFDPQDNLTKGLGYRNSSLYSCSLKELLINEMNEIDAD